MSSDLLPLLPPEMAGRRVLVTGAGSGIGLATVVLLQRAGARVVAVAQDASQVATVFERLSDAVVLQQDLLDDAGSPDDGDVVTAWRTSH